MPISATTHEANTRWNKKAYDYVNIRFKKGQKEIIKTYAATIGESLNGFVSRAVDEAIERGKRNVLPLPQFDETARDDDVTHREGVQPSPASWLDEFNSLLNESGDEILRMEDFPRANFAREHLEVKP